MNAAAEQVLTAALTLPDPDRLELVEALIASLGGEDALPLHPSWRAVIDRRSNELRMGAVLPIPRKEVK